MAPAASLTGQCLGVFPLVIECPQALDPSRLWCLSSRGAIPRQTALRIATLTNKPHSRPWGIYSGYFRDLDGHLWEILWNPQIQIKD